MSVEHVSVIICKKCGEVLSVPVRELHDLRMCSEKEKEYVVPSGSFVQSDQLVREELFYGTFKNEIIIGREDL